MVFALDAVLVWTMCAVALGSAGSAGCGGNAGPASSAACDMSGDCSADDACDDCGEHGASDAFAETEGDPGDVEMALQMANALNPNALNPNALNPNALRPAVLGEFALAASSLGDPAFAPLSAPGASGMLSRELFRYAVRCALDASQSVTLSWVDGHGDTLRETYRGSVGLAPSWAQGPLVNEDEQRWVSACLAALTNWYGVEVVVSLRGPHAALAQLSPEEATYYTVREGAFWGNLFAPEPRLWACHEPANVAHAEAADRECAIGHPGTGPNGQTIRTPCGPITPAGACAEICTPVSSAGGFLPSCQASTGATPIAQVITTYLD
ncbi:Hypothetical protein CAP_5698 [Chondromyces apiculatus DSM 436]|uniref:Lipoprotein n=2 Tax=Chondromyces apiculatus TaxID=51 RepID=A0A017T460_9BACT|nr:Hypothetical protein CAP_5698 [Chondromyces apiculatus DSM 436]